MLTSSELGVEDFDVSIQESEAACAEMSSWADGHRSRTILSTSQPNFMLHRSSSVISSAVSSTTRSFSQTNSNSGQRRMESLKRHQCDRVEPSRSLLQRQAEEMARVDEELQEREGSRQIKRRRHTMRWTAEEENRLVQLFLEYGPSWELILDKDKQIGRVFSSHRTGVDIMTEGAR